MRRRQFVQIAIGAATGWGWPFAARAQQKAIPVIGFLGSASPGPAPPSVTALRQGLSESGYVEGRNVGLCWFWLSQYDPTPVVPKNCSPSNGGEISARLLSVSAKKA